MTNEFEKITPSQETSAASQLKVDPEKLALAQQKLTELNDAELANRILQHPKLVNLLGRKPFFDFEPKGLTPGFQGDIRKIDDKLADDYIGALHTQNHDSLPKTQVSRIVGTSSEAAEMGKHRLEVLQVRESRITNERVATKEEQLMIARAEKNVNALRAQHGLPPVSLPPERVRMITDRELKDEFRSAEADHQTQFQRERISEGGLKGLFRFARIQHELIHAGSYEALQKLPTGEIEEFRVGMKVRGRKPKKDSEGHETNEYPSFLTPLNEAVTEENTRRIVQSISQDDPEFGTLAQDRQKQLVEYTELQSKHPKLPKVQGEEFYGCEIDMKQGTVSIGKSAYKDDRQSMWKLFDRIHEKNPGAFPEQTQGEAREAVFQMVTKASLTGNILPFGRLMNKTFGQGTFRNYGHLQSPQEINSFLDSLETIKKEPPE